MNEESVVSAKDSEKQVLRQQLRSSVGADDPFYPRQGKSLTWKNVNMTVVSFFFKNKFHRLVMFRLK